MVSFGWASDRPELKFPSSGLLRAEHGSEVLGALGFRAAADGCELWHESASSNAPWPELIERITAQARKSRYVHARLATQEPLPPELSAALAEAGFSGEPLGRDLVCDAPADLQPYLDWNGAVIRLLQGKGSDAINTRLFEWIAAQIPVGEPFSEPQINERLKRLHLFGDHASVRRELIDRGLMQRTRECTRYWRERA